MIVHIQTTIQSILGRVDAEGNVTEQIPVNLNLNILKPELFQEAFKHLENKKKELENKENPE